MARGLVTASRRLRDSGAPRKKSGKGSPGYDNPRRVIDPNIRTKNIETKEARIGGYKLPTADGNADEVLKTDGAGTCSWTAASAGEANTASNTGSAGTGLYKEKSGVDLKFYKLNAGSSKITVALDGTDKLDLDVVEGQINHDNLTGIVANEHLDWTSDQGATNIHSGNIPDLSATYSIVAHDHDADYAPIAKGVTNGDSHDHSGGDGAQVDHTTLSNVGTNTHAQIDTALTNSANHIADNSQAHSDYLINNGDDSTSGKITAANLAVTGDNNTNDSEYVPMVLHGTDATPPAASGFPRGTIYIQYTA